MTMKADPKLRQMFRDMPKKDRIKALLQLSPEEQDALVHDWSFLGRDEQMIPPKDDWSVWLYMAGRGAGKTRTGAETVREVIKRGEKYVGLVAPTAAAARDVMIEGESGLMKVCWEGDEDIYGNKLGMPVYKPAIKRVIWENGAVANVFSSAEPDQLRGPQHGFVWADELCAWDRDQETWDNVLLGLRLGKEPWAFISTTPKPTPLMIKIYKSSQTIVTRGTTYDNRDNLAPTFFKTVVADIEGTRLGRQELEGELLMEAEGALWSREMIDATRISKKDLKAAEIWRIVVAVDPAIGKSAKNNETGIVVAGLGRNGHGYVLADYTARYTPAEWAEKVIFAYNYWKADKIVAEGNQGGEMVKTTIASADPTGAANIHLVFASQGKQARAEPISALFEKKRCHMVGTDCRELEDQLCTWAPEDGKESPDRLDAMVWAFTDLIVKRGRMTVTTLKGL
jgi:phage terminase large subunit-like protein